MNILVTGGAGYIGSQTTKLLIEKGFDPIIFDSLENGFRDSVLTDRFIQGDLRNINDLRDVFKKNKIDLVMHFAAYASVPDSVINPNKYYENNILGGLNLLNVMLDNDCHKMIFSSSASVYGEPIEEVIKEDHPKNPTNPYGHTKLIFEQILDWYSKAYFFSSISFRYFCAAGADSEGILGEMHNPETHLIPSVILTALGQRDKFEIFGDDYNTPDGTCIRDFIHVYDVAMAHIQAVDKLVDRKSLIFNLGIKKGFSVLEIVDIIKSISKKDFLVEIKNRRVGDPSILIADNSKAVDFLDWRPKYTNISDIVRTAYNFLERNITS